MIAGGNGDIVCLFSAVRIFFSFHLYGRFSLSQLDYAFFPVLPPDKRQLLLCVIWRDLSPWLLGAFFFAALWMRVQLEATPFFSPPYPAILFPFLCF